MELRFFCIKSTLAFTFFSNDFTESFFYSRVYDLGGVPKQVVSMLLRISTVIIAIDAHCSCAPTAPSLRNSASLTTNILPSLRKMEQNLQINGYTRNFSP